MHGWLLLIWVQGLKQAALFAAGATAGTVVTKGNVSAVEGGSVILQCNFSSTTAEVTQVNWEQRDQPLAIYNADLGWHVSSVFSDRVVPGPSLGLTFQSLALNDTGEYICIYHTYPDGIYNGKIFLHVQGRSAKQFQIAFVGAMAAVLGVICSAVAGVVILARKKSRRIHTVESDLGRMAAELKEWSLSIPSSPGSPDQTEAAPAGLCGECDGDDCAEPHDYFNVLSYRSLGSISFLVETD
ncbi:T-cell immunoreceptor with Ig and ITIM domains [Nannospalax galili]|uniref:T-cell immunoreceptor with Ig and ITIM domains n=1 Tax=Nannospalax galili TaxID=1026970 RepID=UPI0004ED07B1|nr:T-cell immunoreceptor with Ig and ITIM domains [Nannospalax galili]